MAQQTISEDEIKQHVAESFAKPDRVQTILVRDWQLTIIISCDHRYGKVNLLELTTLADKFEVPSNTIDMWDIAPNVLEIFIDLDAPPPTDSPAAKRRALLPKI